MLRRRSVPRLTRVQVAVSVGLVLFALLGWLGVTTVGRGGALDSGEHVAYAEYLDAHGHLPPKSVNYEYGSPPLFQATAVAAEHVVRWLPSHWAELPWNPVTRVLWLVLAVAAIACLASARPRLRAAGLGGLLVAAVWGLDEAISLGKTEAWSAGRLISFAACVGLVVLSGLIGREVWPESTRRAFGTAGFVAAYPVVFRMGVLFHPEMPLAFLCSLALLIFLRASRRGWPPRLGWALGAACGLAALTRQTALVVIVCVAAAALAVGRRGAGGFIARAAVIVVLVAGPWWGYAYHRWHNPLQSNLEPRASLMLGSQPASFYVSFPVRTLVIHPFRPDSSNELLPKLHEDLWSDWFGAFHDMWQSPSRLDRVTASTQSVLGLVGDGLAIAGLLFLALPAGRRVLVRRSAAPGDVGLGLLALVTLVGFAAFVVELIRFPQQYGDPIKSSYLLFTAHCWAAFSVAAWAWLRGRSPQAHAVLLAVASLYLVSYGTALGSSFSRGASRIVGGAAGAVDLTVQPSGSATTSGVGGDLEYAVGVTNSGNQTATSLVLTVGLSPGMHLLGLPYYERGSGCTGTTTLTCNLDFLPAGGFTLIRFEVQFTESGDQTLTTSASSAQPDVSPADNSASLTVHVS